MKNFFAALQQLGRAMMLPIAVLPVAALLLRLGQADLLDMPAIAAAGDAVFANLGMLFGIGIAVGLARENHGAAGLAGLVAYLVATKGAEVIIAVPPDDAGAFTGAAADLAKAAFRAKEIGKLSVPVGILSGVIAGAFYNRYSDIRLPAYLAFFGGRRFVPILSGFAGLGLAFAFGYGWPVLERGMDTVSRAVLGSGEVGLFAYGVLNRALIVTGLHHIANNLAWFVIGEYGGVTGDLKRFFAGDPSAGAFMSGFFPVMMFGLPAACLAMYRTAHPERRASVGGMLTSMALTSFLTGVTEPIEFAFMFIAPVLYGIHAVLTGLAMVIMHVLGVHLGFGFSAGLFDYVINFKLSTRPWLLVPIGLAYFAIYYTVFRYAIVKLNLATPGREPDETIASQAVALPAGEGGAHDWVRALGGAGNLTTVDACTTRLRLIVADSGVIDEPTLRALGARGFVRPSGNTLQVVVGPMADQLAGDIRAAMRGGGPPQIPAGGVAQRADNLAQALGGRANLTHIEVRASRLVITLRDAGAADESAIRRAGFRGAVQVAAQTWHVLAGTEAEAAATRLR